MGTYYTKGADKAAIVRECLNITNGTVEAHTVKGRHLWALIATTRDGKPHKYVILFKLENDPGYGWGYKPISDDMGPYDCDCPVEYVKACEPFPALAYARDFRDRVYKANGITRAA